MAIIEVTKQIVLEIRELGCGHYAALPQSRWTHLYQSGETIWCPYGETVSYSGSENKKLRDRLADAQEHANREASRAMAEAGARRIAEEQLAALGKRVTAGVCPHCRRTFKQLQRHMESKHLLG